MQRLQLKNGGISDFTGKQGVLGHQRINSWRRVGMGVKTNFKAFVKKKIITNQRPYQRCKKNRLLSGAAMIFFEIYSNILNRQHVKVFFSFNIQRSDKIKRKKEKIIQIYEIKKWLFLECGSSGSAVRLSLSHASAAKCSNRKIILKISNFQKNA